MYVFLPVLAGALLSPDAVAASPQGQELEFVETFQDARNLDRRASSGEWGGSQAVPGNLGGDGRHGSFDPSLGEPMGPFGLPGTYVWNTDHMVIPGDRTLSGKDETVTDGRFYFTDFFVGTGETVVFTGTHPVQIFVRGQVLIAGQVLANGADRVPFAGRPIGVTGRIEGQAGGAGGPGGSRGGDGAASGNGNGTGPDFQGKDGEDVKLPAGHAYAGRATGTGGKGSGQFPSSGLVTDIVYEPLFGISLMIGAGGGGGGFGGAGSMGLALAAGMDNLPINLGPHSEPGGGMDLFPIPVETTSLDPFMVGGSGGGGGGSHAFFASVQLPDEKWKAGAGGTGGGGALALRAGHEVRILSPGVVQARGGDGATFMDTSLGLPMPGGGGSGGSILVQSGLENGVVQGGTLDARGGQGSKIFFGVGLLSGISMGGEGAPGVIRVETPDGNPNPGQTVPVAGPQSTGVLLDRDLVVGSQSLWYPIGQALYRRYEIDARVDGRLMVFSDNTLVGDRADLPDGPLYVLFQAAQVDSKTREALPDTAGPWRKYLHSPPLAPRNTINLDSGDAFRFLLLFNKAVAQEIVVQEVRVYYESLGGGTQSGLEPYGNSTPGCQGISSIGANSEPTLGNSTFAVTCLNAPRSLAGCLVLSGAGLSSPMVVSGVDVWIDLASPLLSFSPVLSDLQGALRFDLPLPSSSSLAGVELFAQFAWPDLCARGGVAASDALSFRLY